MSAAHCSLSPNGVGGGGWGEGALWLSAPTSKAPPHPNPLPRLCRGRGSDLAEIHA